MVTLTLIALLNLSSSVFEPPTYNEEIVGEYLAYKVVHDPADGTGWALSERFERKLILQADHTYKEINSSFEAFDAADYEGEWAVKNDTLLLAPKGYLTFKDGKYRPGIMNHSHNKDFSTNKLLILSDNELQILEKGFMEGEVLERLTTSKDN